MSPASPPAHSHPSANPRSAAREARILADMQRWLERAVIGLNLCPFAKAVHARGQVHWVVSQAVSTPALEQDLLRELDALAAADPAVRDTTLLVVPQGLEDFFEFNLFVADAARLLKRRGLAGMLQIASFHPQFQFAHTAPQDPGNNTNRAPYPTLHLLREASIARAVQAFPEAETIYGNNIRTLERLGLDGWNALGVGGSAPEAGEGP
jgi:hypothetical protein